MQKSFEDFLVEIYQGKNGLDRFIVAQRNTYSIALKEIQAGEKETHWMWFIFPQIKGLGLSDRAIFYSLEDKEEAIAYMEHPILGKRLIQISTALFKHKDKNIVEIMGEVDTEKLKSSMTLFASLPHTNPIFSKILHVFFDGQEDERTQELL